MRDDVDDVFFATKRIARIEHDGGARTTTIVCQNANGPCPLIAIANACALRGALSVKDFLIDDDDDGTTRKTTTEGDDDDDVGGVHIAGVTRAIERVIAQRRARDARDANVARACEDALEALTRAARGVDVNVKFTSCDSFEYTSAIGIFDACDVALKHAWVVSAEEHGEETRECVAGRASYDALVERLIDLRTTVEESARRETTTTTTAAEECASSPRVASDAPPTTTTTTTTSGTDADDVVAQTASLRLDVGVASSSGDRDDDDDDDASDALARAVHELMIIEDFLDSTRGQLTRTGVEEMRDTMRDGAYAVFFRNNHFSVAHKRDEQLYTLVTDQGYLHEPDVVWECLGGARDGEFVTGRFTPFQARASASPLAPAPATSSRGTTLPADFLRTTTTSGDDERRVVNTAAATTTTMTTAGVAEPMSAATIDTDADYAAALQLQFDAEDEARRRRDAAAASANATTARERAHQRSSASSSRAPTRKKPSKSKSSECVVQ